MSQPHYSKIKTSFLQKAVLITLGIILTFIILEMSLRLGGFVLTSIQEYRNLQSLKRKGAYRILCLGESTTAGQYTFFLEEILNQRNIGIQFSVIDKGVQATNTSLILENLLSDLDAYHPHMVIAMMGINDKGLPVLHDSVSGFKPLNLLRNFKVYKLGKLLWLHMKEKAKELKAVYPQLISRGDKVSTQVYAKNKATRLNTGNDRAHVGLSRFYQSQGGLVEAEALFKKAIGVNPKNVFAYMKLGRIFRLQGKFAEAEAQFKKAIEVDPGNCFTYIVLGQFYQDQGWLIQAEALFKKATEVDPRNDMAFEGLGQARREQSKSTDAELSYKKAIELNPNNYNAYFGLGQSYEDQGKFIEAEDLFKRVMELSQDEVTKRRCVALMEVYREKRRTHERNEKAGNQEIFPLSINSYQKLKKILDKKGIRLVCVQYPLRNVDDLRKIFKGNAEGIVFVDNERLFKNMLGQGRYEDYFRDRFAGDFGHCTDKGNRLLAENIAKTILQEVFHK